MSDPAARLRAARDAAGLTQSALAARLGLAPQYLSDLERGRRPLSPRLALWIASTMGWAPGDLDPGLAGLGPPPDRIALDLRPDGLFHAASEADAVRLARVGWPAGPVAPSDLARLATAAGEARLPVYLLALPPEDDGP